MYPETRMRRLRRFESLRLMIRETELNVKDLILPLFVVSGKKVKKREGLLSRVAEGRALRSHGNQVESGNARLVPIPARRLKKPVDAKA